MRNLTHQTYYPHDKSLHIVYSKSESDEIRSRCVMYLTIIFPYVIDCYDTAAAYQLQAFFVIVAIIDFISIDEGKIERRLPIVSDQTVQSFRRFLKLCEFRLSGEMNIIFVLNASSYTKYMIFSCSLVNQLRYGGHKETDQVLNDEMIMN
uniref:Uncharacterized protein n=1 Tax=Romanomermis culicivorax TaxID=13658 RepID=A0A915IZG2_ROMCU